jgi:ABC-2 type transport system permease protein
MSEEMQRWGQLTFNAWALDGYQKVFWHDLPVDAIFVEIKVLLAMAVVLAIIARVFADRWEN